MPAITSLNAAEGIAKLVATEALEALVGNLVMGRLVNRNYDSVLATGGDTVSIAIPAPMASNPISEGGTVTLQSPDIAFAQIVLNRHKEASFQIPDVTAALNNVDLRKMQLNESAIAIAENIETDLLGCYPDFTYNAILGGASTITEAVIDAAETNLFIAKVPASQPRYLVVAPTTFSAMRQISHFVEYQMTGEAGIISSTGLAGRTNGPNGADGMAKGALVYRSQYVPNVSGTNQNLMFSRDALALVMRKLPLAEPGLGVIQGYAEYMGYSVRTTMSYQAGVLGNQMTLDVFYGCDALRQNFAEVIQAT